MNGAEPEMLNLNKVQLSDVTPTTNDLTDDEESESEEE